MSDLLRAWYVPSFSGDFRLERLPDITGASQLTVETPTLAEQAILSRFLATCARCHWIEGDPPACAAEGRTEIRLGATLEQAGPVLAGISSVRHGSLTAIRSVDGTMTVDISPVTALATAQVKKEKKKETEDPPGPGDAAVTVRRPTPCCPLATQGPEVRSSEVLHAFCTDRQWATWTSAGYLVATGGWTGHAYLLAHRNSPWAARNTKVCRDLDDDVVIHFHDSLLPPAEEILSAKLILEHKEPWLRNGSTCFGGREVFTNPLGHPSLDGTRDAAMADEVGQALLGLARAWTGRG